MSSSLGWNGQDCVSRKGKKAVNPSGNSRMEWGLNEYAEPHGGISSS